ncbi:MAG TPA: 4Fe-4S binding protein, partial [Thauera sp.]
MNTEAPARKPQRVIPIATAPAGDAAAAAAMQRRRRAFQAGFFALFVLAPVFDLFRYDLDADHAWLLGMEWRLGLDPFLAGQASALEAAGSIILNLFVPLLALAALVIGAAWKWGRLYCGWLCPHF